MLGAPEKVAYNFKTLVKNQEKLGDVILTNCNLSFEKWRFEIRYYLFI